MLGKRIINLLKSYSGTFFIVLGFIVIYTLMTGVFGILDPLLFPTPSKIMAAFINSFPRLMESFLSSMSLLIPGYLIGGILGIILGIWIASYPTLNKAFKPIIFSLSPIPPSMLVPYLIAILPTFYLSSVAIIFIGCFWPFLSSTIHGISLIDQKYLNNAKVLEIKGLKKLIYIILTLSIKKLFLIIFQVLKYLMKYD